MATIYTDSGEAITTDALAGGSLAAEPLYVAMGTGAGTAAKADTTLFTESAEARVSGTSSRFTSGSTNNGYRVVGTQTASGARAITNAGNFDASTSGNIFIKGDFSTINLASGDSLQQTDEVVFA
jgi:hypothetical protein